MRDGNCNFMKDEIEMLLAANVKLTEENKELMEVCLHDNKRFNEINEMQL